MRIYSFSISDHLCISGMASESGGGTAVQTRPIYSTLAIVPGPQDICDPRMTERLNTDTSVGRSSPLSTGVAELMGSKPGGTGGHLILKRTYTK